MSEIVCRSPEIIAGEIAQYSYRLVEDAVEIGRRLVELKASVRHGEYGVWLKKIGYSKSSANAMVRMFEAYAANEISLTGAVLKDQTYGRLGYSKALALLDVPEEQRRAFVDEHGADHIAEEMSVRELKEEIRRLKDRNQEAQNVAEGYRMKAEAAERSRAEADLARESADKLAEELKLAQGIADELQAEKEQLSAKVQELENRPVEVAVKDASAEQIAEAEKRGRIAAEKETAGRMEEAGAVWKETLNRQQEKTKAAIEEVERLREELEQAESDPKKVAIARVMGEINANFKAMQTGAQAVAALLDKLDEVSRKRASSAMANALKAMAQQLEGREGEAG